MSEITFLASQHNRCGKNSPARNIENNECRLIIECIIQEKIFNYFEIRKKKIEDNLEKMFSIISSYIITFKLFKIDLNNPNYFNLLKMQTICEYIQLSLSKINSNELIHNTHEIRCRAITKHVCEKIMMLHNYNHELLKLIHSSLTSSDKFECTNIHLDIDDIILSMDVYTIDFLIRFRY